MKKSVLLLISIFITHTLFAQINADSLAYELQRKKINSMLDERRQKFSQYDQSLQMHTGIFGLQTKKDIRRSNDILMSIVQNDDAIFKQTKVLLDYRIFQQTQVQTHSNQVENDVLGYMSTINKLRDQLNQVKKDAGQQHKDDISVRNISWIIIAILVLAILLMLRRKRT
jgi:hypothetical protein